MFAGVSIWQLLIILAIIVLLFGTKKLRNIGQDLGGAVKGFKDAMHDGERKQDQELEQKRLAEEDQATPRQEQKKDQDQV